MIDNVATPMWFSSSADHMVIAWQVMPGSPRSREGACGAWSAQGGRPRGSAGERSPAEPSLPCARYSSSFRDRLVTSSGHWRTDLLDRKSARNFGHVNAVRPRVPSLRINSNVSFWIELRPVRKISPSVLATMSGLRCGSATGWPDLALDPLGATRREPCKASGLSAKDGQPRPRRGPRRIHVLTSGLSAVCDAPCRRVPRGARILVGRMSLPISCRID
jgi:hypothetical protein